MKISSINRIILLINIALLIICIIAYKYIFQVETTKKIYSEESSKFVEENKNPVYKIDQIILYSSANVVDNSNGQLKSLDISQFTDIEIIIDNKSQNSEITAENTINELFIDNIKIESASENGEKIFNYKNPLQCGKYVELENWRDDGILFNVVNSNEKNRSANYDENIFYTDCSNPISLGFINKNILTNCEVSSDNASIAFDGSILAAAGIDLESLDATITFSLHLINNYHEEYVCNIKIENDLTSEEGIYSGYLMKIITPTENEYDFIKITD